MSIIKIVLVILLAASVFAACAPTVAAPAPGAPVPTQLVAPPPTNVPPPTLLPPATQLPQGTNAPAQPTRAPSAVVTQPATPTELNLTATPGGGGSVSTDPTLVKLIAAARADLSQRLSAKVDDIRVTSAQPVEWSDASLGCPKRGVMYIQVITPGYQIVLEMNGQEFDYHADNQRVFLCEKQP